MMLVKAILAAIVSATFVAAQSDSEIVGVFILGRHGDRTSKIQGLGIEGSSVLTTLGKNQVFESGTYFRNYYLNSSGPNFIQGVNSNYQFNQIYASAPNDNVLFPSATGFWQGMFPPSNTATLQTLANGTTESTPLDGYQYVSLNGLPATSPDIIWIAGDQTCPTMTTASLAYYNSTTFLGLQTQLQPFYNKFKPLLAGFFTDSQIGFQSAYNIFDYINVGYIHNATIYNDVAWEDLFQLRTLADQQSFDLNYNMSSPNASIGGMTIAGSVLSRLNVTVSQSSPNMKITYFAGAYSPMMAFWGLAGLANASTNFTGLPDYASASVFELRRPAGSTGFDDLTVRFGFRNGTNSTNEVNYFPMFNYNSTDMPWSQWSSAMSKISISSDGSWCNLCNSSLVFCTGSGKSSTTSTSPSSSSTTPSSSGSSSGLSNAAAGGIGAGVTIGVIAIIEGLVALWYFSSRKRNGRSNGRSTEKIPSNLPSESGSA